MRKGTDKFCSRSIFRMQIYFLYFSLSSSQAHKSELEIELNGSTVEWTDEKSSRKNVFQLNSRSDLQMLFQSEDKNLATEWFEEIKRISESNVVSFSLLILDGSVE